MRLGHFKHRVTEERKLAWWPGNFSVWSVPWLFCFHSTEIHATTQDQERKEATNNQLAWKRCFWWLLWLMSAEIIHQTASEVLPTLTLDELWERVWPLVVNTEICQPNFCSWNITVCGPQSGGLFHLKLSTRCFPSVALIVPHSTPCLALLKYQRYYVPSSDRLRRGEIREK